MHFVVLACMKKSKVKIVAFTLAIGLLSCNKDEADPVSSTVITSTGNMLELSGTWLSSCVQDNGITLNESFEFNANSLTIAIDFYESMIDGVCTNPEGSEVVKIDYTVGTTFQALLNGAAVVANRISGNQTLSSTGQTTPFKQAFFIDDSGTETILYHARFQDDGGATTSDGFPSEIIPIGIVRQ